MLIIIYILKLCAILFGGFFLISFAADNFNYKFNNLLQ